MKRYLFRVYYSGHPFCGFQRQPNGQAIKNYIEFAFLKCQYILSFKKNDYRPSSRTDAGVNALSNMFTLNLPEPPNLEYINNYLPINKSIIVWDFAEVSDDFDPRSAYIKHYAYFIPPSIKSVYNLHRIFEFIGLHDFSNFIIKGGAGSKHPFSEIYHIDVNPVMQGFWISLKGSKFGREQIRRIIGFLLDKRYTHLSPSIILKQSNLTLKIVSADPKFLVLVDIIFKQKINWNLSSKNLHFITNKRKLILKNAYYLSKFHYYLINQF